MTAKKKTTAAVAAKQVKAETEAPVAPAISAAPVDENTGSADVSTAAVEQANADAPADLPAAAEFAPSGAPVQVVPDVEPSHPAVDANPRANTTEAQNRIDFNDPTISGQEAVERNLGLK